MNIKQRVFIDIINQIPYGSNKMATKDNVSSAYCEELKADSEAVALATTVVEGEINHKVDWNNGTERWFVYSKIIHRAYEEVREATAWLLANGYIRSWKTKVRFGTATYYGLTAKGWAVADRYIALAKAENN